ncbi:hypothetical protein [Sphingomonas sp. NPDC079357]|jgi:hypothetical protein|uniref:hypothetical protein n=1 Tax=Sphingomonas sp. NPDC079357 TaxID=3364518 RepID=UPI00384B7E5C
MKLQSVALALGTCLVSAPTLADTDVSTGGGGCASDVSFTGGSSLVSCYGRDNGNVLSNSANSNTTANAALDALGCTSADIKYGAIPAQIKVSVGSQAGSTISFTEALNGIT